MQISITFVQELRYFAPLYPFLAIGLAVAFAELLDRQRNRPRWVRATALLVLVVGFGLATAGRATYGALNFHHLLGELAELRQTKNVIRAAVRQHLAESRVVLFVYDPDMPRHLWREAWMAGAIPATMKDIAAGQLDPHGPVVLMTVLDDPAVGATPSEPSDLFPQPLRDKDFQVRPVARLRQGWLCESCGALGRMSE